MIHGKSFLNGKVRGEWDRQVATKELQVLHQIFDLALEGKSAKEGVLDSGVVFPGTTEGDRNWRGRSISEKSLDEQNLRDLQHLGKCLQKDYSDFVNAVSEAIKIPQTQTLTDAFFQAKKSIRDAMDCTGFINRSLADPGAKIGIFDPKSELTAEEQKEIKARSGGPSILLPFPASSVLELTRILGGGYCMRTREGQEELVSRFQSGAIITLRSPSEK
jgi:hypothetical protein